MRTSATRESKIQNFMNVSIGKDVKKILKLGSSAQNGSTSANMVRMFSSTFIKKTKKQKRMLLITL